MEFLSGLIGALIGGGFALLGVVAQERYQARRDERSRDDARRAEQKAAAHSALIAARILQGDLAWAESRVKRALNRKPMAYWNESYALSEAAWLNYRESIASFLPDEDWSTVRDGFRALRAVELQARVRRQSADGPAKVTATGAGLLREGLEKITSAIVALEPLAKARPTAELDSELDESDDS